MRPIAGTSRRWTFRSAASVLRHRHDRGARGLAPYDSALDLAIARLLAEPNATSLRAAAVAAAP